MYRLSRDDDDAKLSEDETRTFGVSMALEDPETDPSPMSVDVQEAIDSVEANKSNWSIPVDRALGLNTLHVAAWSYLGVFVRRACGKLCQELLSTVPEPWQAPVVFNIFFGDSVFGGHGHFLANLIGCITMGLLSKVQPLVETSCPHLYVGFSTGFCGCLTTFATWNQNQAQAAARSSGYDSYAKQEVSFSSDMSRVHWFDAYFLLFVEFMLFYAALIAGQMLGESLHDCFASSHQEKQECELGLPVSRMVLEVHKSIRQSQHRSSRSVAFPEDIHPGTHIDAALATAHAATQEAAYHARTHHLEHMTDVDTHFNDCLGASVLVSMTILAWCLSYLAEGWWQATGRCMVFAPAGAVLRYLLSLYNKNCGFFKTFTFIPNVLASAVDAAIFASGLGSHNAWAGYFGTGFCGSLSTVSTFVNECSKLTNKQIVMYAGLTFGVSQFICGLIISLAVECPSNEYYWAAIDITAGEFKCHNS